MRPDNNNGRNHSTCHQSRINYDPNNNGNHIWGSHAVFHAALSTPEVKRRWLTQSVQKLHPYPAVIAFHDRSPLAVFRVVQELDLSRLSAVILAGVLSTQLIDIGEGDQEVSCCNLLGRHLIRLTCRASQLSAPQHATLNSMSRKGAKPQRGRLLVLTTHCRNCHTCAAGKTVTDTARGS